MHVLHVNFAILLQKFVDSFAKFQKIILKFQITNIIVNVLIKTQVILKLSESNSQKKREKVVSNNFSVSRKCRPKYANSKEYSAIIYIYIFPNEILCRIFTSLKSMHCHLMWPRHVGHSGILSVFVPQFFLVMYVDIGLIFGL